MIFRKLPSSFSGVLAAGVLIGFGVLYLASITTSFIQVILELISMALVFFSVHPLAHYCYGLTLGVRTKYFFLSSSDFRKLGGPIGKLGSAIPTIGVKFDLSRLQTISRSRKAFLFGAGAIVSNVVMLVILSLTVILNFGVFSIIIGTLFVLASFGTELLFSTKVGDLSKMRRELKLT